MKGVYFITESTIYIIFRNIVQLRFFLGSVDLQTDVTTNTTKSQTEKTKLDRNGEKQTETVKNGQKKTEMNQTGQQRSERDKNRQKYS